MKQDKNIWLTLLFCLTATCLVGSEAETLKGDRTPGILRDLRVSSSSRVLIAAHRGGYENDKADEAPENSIANIRNCKSKGYELYETDIQRTKDGRFVIIHDPTIERETSGAGKVSEMNLVELREKRKRYRDGSLSRERVASLEDFLKQGKGRTVFKTDMKPGVSKHFDEIMKLVAEHDALDGIIFRVPYRDAGLYAQYRTDGGLYAKHLFMFKVSSRKQIDDIQTRFDSTTIEITLDKSNPSHKKTLDLIRYATDRGFVVETHAEGSPDDWVKLIEAGVRIFHTKAPSKVRKLLQSLADSK